MRAHRCVPIWPVRVALTLLTLAAAAGTVPATAEARCRVVPAPDGEVSTWLVAGPWSVPASRPAPTFTAVFHRVMETPPPGALAGAGGDGFLRPGVAAGGVAWRPAADARSHLDVGAAVGGHGPRTALAGLTLDVTTEGDRLLFLGTDDAVRILLDGHEVFRRESPRASRDDDDAVPLHLTAGRHALVARLVTRGDMDLFARLTDTAGRPDPAVAMELTGVDDTVCTDLARRATALSVTRRVTEAGTRVDVGVSWPGGTATPDAERVRTVTLTAPDMPPANAVVTLGDSSVGAMTVSAVLPAAGARSLTVDVGGMTRAFPVSVTAAARAALLRAETVLAPLDPGWGATDPSALPVAAPRTTATLPAGSIWSVERSAQRLADLVATADTDGAMVSEEASMVTDLLGSLAAGRDPYAGRHGALRRAYRSPLDGSLQEYSVYVPPSYTGDRVVPLIAGLHGLHGSAHRMLPVLVGLYDESESRTHADRHLPPLPDTRALLVAPYGHGDAGYRQQGEYDVMRVLDEVRSAYRVDPDRTYMTGLSMGGIGAASIPLHRPDVFAAAAPLCGYHSYFVRGDTRGVRRPWELFLMEARSNANWAENGLNLPMYVVQGTRDLPLSNSQVLVDRYQALHYTMESEWPPLGHNVWGQTYANGRIIPYFLQFRRDASPAHLRFRTPDLRWRRDAWLTVDGLTAPGAWGDVDLTVDRGGTAHGTTHNVSALTVTPPSARVAPDVRAARLTLDGDTVTLPLDTATSLVRTGNHWRAADVGQPLDVHPHGPIREVFDSPLLFVVGTAEAGEARLNDRVARAWAHHPGVQVHYPVVRDDSYTDAMGQGRTLVLVGTPRGNRLLARMADRLPVRVEGQTIRVGNRTITGAHLGSVFATADPDHPERTVLVITGTDALGTWRSRSLPDLLPDYVVYDDRVAPARGRVLLGAHAGVLAAGFFTAAGLPAGADTDPITVTAAGDDDAP